MIKNLLIVCSLFLSIVAYSEDKWPDGTTISTWFADTAQVDINSLGKQYVLTNYGIRDDDATLLQTEKIQALINIVATNGGGVVVVPEGTFLTGAIFFPQGVHLHLKKGATLKGIDDIAHYPIVKTRLEGQTLKYFSALINADSVDGFTISGNGVIDGNGQRFWREFWLRREINSNCTNLEAMRPRLIYISNSQNVTISGVTLRNSPFWTTHIYRSERVKILGVTIFAPHSPLKAPSSDAIDIDNCTDVLINGCYMSVNDDAVVMKGGKGVWADKNVDNGPNYNVLIQNCIYGFVHACLTLGSESIFNHNIVLRNSTIKQAERVLWLKMRPDTPQIYEYVTVENIIGECDNFVYIKLWTQFFKPEQRDDMPMSKCSKISIKNIKIKCNRFYNVSASDKYLLENFAFENIIATTIDSSFNHSFIDKVKLSNVVLNGQKIK